MNALEDLLEAERGAVDPEPEQLARVRRRVHGALIASSGLATSTLVQSASAQGGLLAKMNAFWGLKSAWLWGAGAVASIGVGYATIQTDVLTPSMNEAQTQATATSSGRSDSPVISAPLRKASAEAVPSLPEAEEKAQPQAPPSSTRAVIPRKQSPRERRSNRLREDARRLAAISAALNRNDAQGALALLREVRVEGSPLASEFQAARAIALCKTGKVVTARQFVRSLEKTAPKSPTLLRVRQACGIEP